MPPAGSLLYLHKRVVLCIPGAQSTPWLFLCSSSALSIRSGCPCIRYFSQSRASPRSPWMLRMPVSKDEVDLPYALSCASRVIILGRFAWLAAHRKNHILVSWFDHESDFADERHLRTCLLMDHQRFRRYARYVQLRKKFRASESFRVLFFPPQTTDFATAA